MTALPVWLRGQNVTVCAITPQTVASDGTLSAGSTSSLVGTIDTISIRSTIEAEEISPMTTTRTNMVPIKVGTTIVLTEILKSSGTNILAGVGYGATSYAYFALTRGAQSFGFYGLITDYSEEISKGKSTGVMTLEMVDPGSANPVYA